jgi:hypothetical protein
VLRREGSKRQQLLELGLAGGDGEVGPATEPLAAGLLLLLLPPPPMCAAAGGLEGPGGGGGRQGRRL